MKLKVLFTCLIYQSAALIDCDNDSLASRLIRICGQSEEVTSPMNAFTFFWHSKVGSGMLCAAPKTASNSWLHFLRSLSVNDVMSHNEDKDYEAEVPAEVSISEECWPRCGQEVPLKLISVRHPLDRLLSAWRHVFQGKFLLPKLTFPEFVDKITSTVQDEEWQKIEAQLGQHWQPLWQHCSVCSFGPSIVLHVETIEKDLVQLLDHLGEDQSLARQFPHLVKNGDEKSSDFYYSQLDQSQMRELLRVYQHDFDLFGYSMSNYP